jgi:Amt family ammonium transporter
VGVFADARWGGTDGALFGRPGQVGLQALGVLATLAYSGAMTFAVLKLVAAVTPLRAATRAEGMGMDITQHGEEAYTEGEGAVLVFPEITPDAYPYPAPPVARPEHA